MQNISTENQKTKKYTHCHQCGVRLPAPAERLEGRDYCSLCLTWNDYLTRLESRLRGPL